MKLNVEQLEDRLALTPLKPPVVLPVGSNPLIDALTVEQKRSQMVEISHQYDNDVATANALSSMSNQLGMIVLWTTSMPLGAYYQYKTFSAWSDLTAHMKQLSSDYWYLSQQVP